MKINTVNTVTVQQAVNNTVQMIILALQAVREHFLTRLRVS